ncbi:preprotein translocase subunit SecA [Brachyspira hyodysenteriae]|uniref:preprotein translocase subunit SecA n=1 Tax=Brachyspira hyodysenteriae TaxID=159 RepID=UPI00063DCD84|nr:preprotein translocase subunit SecA [Brachyspira hyodysenteriae]KLI61454.1 preprotein translocase subunit SecA [Brachyspira hyodysenteriae]
MGAMDLVFKLIFGSKEQNDAKILKPIAEKTLTFEEEIKKLSNEELTNKTKEFRERVEKYIGCKTEELDLSKEENKKKLQNILDEILPEAFAVVREASIRTTGMRHFDVQVMGGAVLHQGRIAEMKTGEGKTLVATLAVYLNALTGLGVHVVTVNDYLAKRDAEWMTPIYSMLGISVGILDNTRPHSPERRAVYNCDVVYGTNNEFGFDYLRDNMVTRKEDKVQRKFYFAIVDEVDSILIDEARTPLIISGPAEKNIKMYYEIDRIIPMLKQAEVDERMREVAGTGDYVLDEKDKNVYLTEEGVHKVEKLLNVENLYGAQSSTIVHHVNQALKAHKVFKKDVDYMVTDGEVLIVDEFTGRVLEGRRYSDGLHQAIEAKEKVAIQNESQTYATITFQNYFRMYPKLSGMTGTAETEAEEFYKIYKLDVAVIPTNKPIARQDLSDRIYRTRKAKFEALAKYIKELQDAGKPALVGTVSVEMNEELSKVFKRHKINHEVLNAKNHSREAAIIAQAGEPGAVTLATNMAGRGTDIVLGGNPVAKGVAEIEQILVLMRDKAFKERDPYKKEELTKKIKSIDLYKEAFVRSVISGKIEEAKELAQKNNADEMIEKIDRIIQINEKAKIDKERVLAAGGLHVIGSERHEARRIDNQLRGRSGRQGDPGLSVFFLSLEDDLMRLFGGERVSKMMLAMGMGEEEELGHKWLNKSIENAQRKVEGRNFDIRKHLLEYDDVMNQQRMAVYGERDYILYSDDISPRVEEIISEVTEETIEDISGNKKNVDALEVTKWLNSYLIGIDEDAANKAVEGGVDNAVKNLTNLLLEAYRKKASEIDEKIFREVEKNIFLSIIDNRWKDHLFAMDSLREGIGLRGYAEKNPLTEYKLEGYKMFMATMNVIHNELVNLIMRVRIIPNSFDTIERESAFDGGVEEKSSASTMNGGNAQAIQSKVKNAQPNVKMAQKIGRNDPCPCGSGKKYKHCHGKDNPQ